MRNDIVTRYANDRLGAVEPGLAGGGTDLPPGCAVPADVITQTDATVQTIVISAAG